MPWFASLSIDTNTGDVTFNSENGSEYDYVSALEGKFDAPFGASSTLAKLASGQYTLTTKGQDVLTFSSSGQLLTEDDPTGRGLSFTYSGSQLTAVKDAAGQQVTLAYTGGLLTKITLPNTHTISYGYTSGSLTSATLPGGPSGYKTTYGYSSAGLLNSVEDPDGHFPVRNTYNSAGQVTASEDATNKTTSFSYTTVNGLNETDTTDPDGGIWTDVYGGNVLLETFDPAGGETTFDYDGLLDVTQATDPAGNATIMTYDSSGNMLTVTDPLGHEQQRAYDSTNNMTSSTDADSNVTTYTYNAMDEVTSITSPSGGKSTFAYDSAGNLTSSVDPRGNVTGGTPATYTTTYGYNPAGQITSDTDPTGGKTSFIYDAEGFLGSATDPQNHVTQYGYDSGEHLTSVTAPDGGVTKYVYDGTGNLTSRTDPDNNSWTYLYDADNRLTKATDPLSNSFSYTYDGNGNQLTSTDGRLVVTTAAYNSDDEPTKVTYSDGTPTVTYGYNADGEATTVTDGTGTRTLAYNAVGALTGVAGPGSGSFAYGYDAAGNETSRTYPDSTKTTYAYTHGQVSSMAAGSATTTYSYDAAGDLISTVRPDGVTQSATYNPDGHATLIKDVKGTTTLDSYGLTLNPDGEPTQVAATQDGAAQPTMYDGYDSAGRLASACLSSTGSAACSAAAAGKATGTSQRRRLPAATAPTAPTGLAVTAGADSAALTWTPPSSTGGAALTGYKVTASPGGRSASVGPYATSATVAGLTSGTAYTFTVTASNSAGSKASAATTAVTPGNETTYSYDKAGNLTGSEADGLTTTSTYNADDELTKAVTGTATVSYGYNADGQQTSAGGLTYSYNAADELSKAVTPAGTFTYGYDSSGDLATTSDGASKIQGTVWDINNALPLAAEDTSSTGATTADYRYDPAGTLASVTGSSSTSYPVTDSLGSVTGLVSAAGAQQTSTIYGPYGTPSTTVLATGSPASSIGYAGSYTLPGGTTLDDMRARDYSPATGAFTSVDPMAMVSGEPYAYASDSPAYYTDPTGRLFGLDNLAAGIIGALVGGGGVLVNDLIYGKSIKWSDVGIAAASGFVFGAVADECGPWCGGASAGFVGNLLGQLNDNGGNLGGLDYGELAAETEQGALMGSFDDYFGASEGAHVADETSESIRGHLWTMAPDTAAGGIDPAAIDLNPLGAFCSLVDRGDSGSPGA
jgi:RHS repeat-associated protein